MPNAAVVAERVDSVLPARVLVYGSVPPDARDLDLLVRPTDAHAVQHALTRAGFVRRGKAFAVFGGCTAFGVELTDAMSWDLPSGEVESLFAEGVPLPGAQRLARPSPGHALLIIARRLAWSRGSLAEKLRPRIDDALEEDRAAWARARLHAPAWGLEDALAALEEFHHGGRPTFVPPARGLALGHVPRPHKPLVVGLSGLDGAGKSSHAAALRDTLEQLGVSAALVWTPLGQNVTLEVIGRPVKKLIRKKGPVLSHTGDAQQTSSRRTITHAWATFVAILNVLAQRRGLLRRGLRARVVVYDRHALDSIVHMRTRYGEAGNTRFQRWLIGRAAPRARLSYYLEVAPETALGRKKDWSIEQLRRQADLYAEECEKFGARRLDGERPREEICAEIAADVWRRLP